VIISALMIALAQHASSLHAVIYVIFLSLLNILHLQSVVLIYFTVERVTGLITW